MATATTKPLTAEDLLHLNSQGVKGELIDGVLKGKVSAGKRHSFIAGNIMAPLHTHVRRGRLSRVGGTDGDVFIRRNPDTVREPDIFFVSAERLPLDDQSDGYLEVVPELVVEIVSPSDSEQDIQGFAPISNGLPVNYRIGDIEDANVLIQNSLWLSVPIGQLGDHSQVANLQDRTQWAPNQREQIELIGSKFSRTC